MPPFMPNTAPIEIWEHILYEAVSFDSNLALSVTCSPETYLAFKATCGDGSYHPSMVAYLESERIRRNLRLVCQAWKAFVDDAKYQDRWVRLWSHLTSSDSYSTWDLPSRIDLDLRRTMMGSVEPSTRTDAINKAMHWLSTWRDWQADGHREMRLVRLEMPSIYAINFDGIFEGLCQASVSLPRLRSLAICVRARNPWVLDALSAKFPKLVHLTLAMKFADEEPSQSRLAKGALSLQQLEVLFLHLDPGCFNLEPWALPRIHTIKMDILPSHWETNLYPFLKRHANTIESLDLDGLDATALVKGIPSPEIILPIDFWDTFGLLRLLRMELRCTVFPGAPRRDHPLKWLVDTNPVNDTGRVGKLIDIGRRRHPRVGPETMALFIQHKENLRFGDLGDAASTLLLEMEINGVQLISSSGERLQQ